MQQWQVGWNNPLSVFVLNPRPLGDEFVLYQTIRLAQDEQFDWTAANSSSALKNKS
jgi:hypothetical protein